MATFEKAAPFIRGHYKVAPYPEAATQSFKAGEVVNLSSGKVQRPVATGNNFGANDLILGVALRDASGTTDTEIPVAIVGDETEVAFPVYHGTPASAITAVTDIGTAYELRTDTISSALANAVDISATTNTKVIPVEIAKQFPVGEQYGVYWCRIRQASRQLG